MQYSKEHINKCAGCPFLNKCALMKTDFQFRTIMCQRLETYKLELRKNQELRQKLNGLSPWVRSHFKELEEYLNSQESALDKDYTMDAIEAGKRRYDRRRKPTYYLGERGKGNLFKRICVN